MIRNNELKVLNVLGISDMVIFKGNEMTIKVPRDAGNKLEDKLIEDEMLALGITVKAAKEKGNYGVDDFYRAGVLLEIKHIRYETDFYVLNIKALEKIRVERFINEGEDLKAEYYIAPDAHDLDGAPLKALLENVKELVKDLSIYFKGSEAFVNYIDSIEDIEQLAGILLQYMQISIDEKYSLFEIPSHSDKGLKLIDILKKQKASYAFQKEMADKFSSEANKNYRKAFLREQLKAIQEELNEGKPEHGKKDYRELIENSTMPEDVKEIALDEVTKLEGLSPQSGERNVVINYLDTLVGLPWGRFKAPEIDIESSRNLLEAEHYGLKEVKDRIIQHLAVMKLKKEKQGSILLLVGPPGTGKTSLGKSIAAALNRPYVRMSLGGVRDEAEVRGHRRTYVAALPGRIIQGMKKAKQTNPIFVLDEIDKLQVANSGDPASALLEVLDPEQNNSFQDHYLEVPYDLSDVFFIATANSLRGIPGPLLDRMEVIEVSSYTNLEKFHIAKRHLIPEVLEDHGIGKHQLEITDEALRKVIDVYTREAGVRNLKRQIASLARAASEKIVLHTVELPYRVNDKDLEELLGLPVARHDMIGKENAPGVVTGLAWTPVGGEILFIEGSFMPGNGQLILTGKLGDVMKESARISLSLVKSRLAFQSSNFEFAKKDLHIHVPSGATPKDGPSAGVALFTAISSLILGRQVPSDLAMTGEVTLRGTVMPVGGIKEKVIAAHRSGVKRVIIPQENEKDLKDIPDEVKEELTFYPVSNIETVLSLVFDLELPEQDFVAQHMWQEHIAQDVPH